MPIQYCAKIPFQHAPICVESERPFMMRDGVMRELSERASIRPG